MSHLTVEEIRIMNIIFYKLSDILITCIIQTFWYRSDEIIIWVFKIILLSNSHCLQLFVESKVEKQKVKFNFKMVIRLFDSHWNLYCPGRWVGGWIGGQMGGLVDCDPKVLLIFFFFQYAKDNVYILKGCFSAYLRTQIQNMLCSLFLLKTKKVSFCFSFSYHVQIK